MKAAPPGRRRSVCIATGARAGDFLGRTDHLFRTALDASRCLEFGTMSTQADLPAKTRSSGEAPLGWLRTEIDRLFENFSAPTRSAISSRLGSLGGFESMVSLPALEMTEKDKEYRLSAEIPGMTEDQIDISVADGRLTISGEKRDEEERKDGDYILSERRYGSFVRKIDLPKDVDANAVTARVDKGVLVITLPKDAKAGEQKRRIPISSGS
ncbi:Hsp20/alpha crystallin family protein [Sphingomonas sp.]|uniref:Hsp20/alpha crystallin family protein n=1 Tax=Sphingomonas sp. TaxID=28214 RepID=UPI002620F497|nr:Hsp20/alpha crystallin family protein [Sphingomonas sp.]